MAAQFETMSWSPVVHLSFGGRVGFGAIRPPAEKSFLTNIPTWKLPDC